MASACSTVPGFDSTLRHLFPEVEEDIENALDLAERMLMLRRRLGTELGARRPFADDEPPGQSSAIKRGWWPFGRKG